MWQDKVPVGSRAPIGAQGTNRVKSQTSKVSCKVRSKIGSAKISRYWRWSVWGVIRERIRVAESGAPNRGLVFEEGIYEKLLKPLPLFCACCGKKLNFEKPGVGLRDSPSIDRVDNNRGYCVDNVEVICHHCNFSKLASDVPFLQKIIGYIQGERYDRQTGKLNVGASCFASAPTCVTYPQWLQWFSA